jgi:chemotaxis protein methyltransferase CheR
VDTQLHHPYSPVSRGACPWTTWFWNSFRKATRAALGESLRDITLAHFEDRSFMALDTLATKAQAAEDADLTDAGLIKIRDLIYRISGIYHAENKFYLLATRARRRMAILKSNTFNDYLDHLTTRANRDEEMRLLLNEITIGETYFFRSQTTMDAVAKIILPKMMTSPSKLSFKKIKIWSAGCSTGEEPYTLAILFLEQLTLKFPGWQFEVTATDLNENSIAKCKEGLYAEYAVRNLNPHMRAKYFKQEGPLYRVKNEPRSFIKFQRLNLQDQSKMLFMKGFDLIFCCNVLIYFDSASKKRAVEHYFNGLVPGGHFFLGECETLFGVFEQFRLVHFPGTTGYYKPFPGDEAGAPK